MEIDGKVWAKCKECPPGWKHKYVNEDSGLCDECKKDVVAEALDKRDEQLSVREAEIIRATTLADYINGDGQ